MSLEETIKENTKAVQENSDLLAKLLKGGGGAPAGDKDEGSRGRGRGRSSDKDDDKGGGKSMSEDDFRDAVKKFMDVESDSEYDKRLGKVLDPVLEKAGVKELKDLPKKYWQDVIDNIADYEKASSGGSRRRAV